MNAMAQHDHHDQQSTALLMGIELTDWDAFPKVSGRYAMEST